MADPGWVTLWDGSQLLDLKMPTVADPGWVSLWDDSRCLDKRAEGLLDYGFRSSTQILLKKKIYEKFLKGFLNY